MPDWISIGVDNGLLGAVVAIDDNFHMLGYWDTPIINRGKGGKTKNEFATAEMGTIFRNILETYSSTKRIMAWIEQAHAMPKQGLSSTFKTGKGFGLWEGICIGMGIRYDIVHPKTWTKIMLKEIPLGDPKSRSMTKCQRLFPNLPLMLPRGRKLTLDGRSDAALLAYYGMLQMRGASVDSRSKKNPPPRRSRRTS